ncbi:inositol monophosphatase [Reticulibacter mediterranei]|uniref:Inositol-1-monophosphatase n=1 Tax=Reticulibacter mediterranei TaxID=2778369 RepID=A0A8J3IR61_9CHLR|nr:inositol monophosphatase family protein [Reticulibacter mediterranei]GHO95427.1 inositol monophosphatase [Reticulibacter mediterranei]
MNSNTVDTTDVPRLLEIAKNAARDAGQYLIQKLGQATIKNQKSSRDDLLDIDLEAENIILTKLRKDAPDIGILSEEAGHEGNHDRYWIVDPLDGSANFQHGSPIFAVAIALVVKQITVGSVIYLPTRDEMFTAIYGQGACLNGRLINTSKTKNLDEAIIHIGDIMKEGDPNITMERLEDVSKLLTQARRVRMIGTAATDLAYVACGRADVLVNHATTPWDVEAGKLLLLEANGKFTEKQISNSKQIFIYSNGVVHEAAEKLLFS